MMGKQYYVLWFRLDGQDLFTIWFSNEFDGILIDESTRMPAFTSVDDLRTYAESRGISLVDEEPVLHNLDVLADWLENPTAKFVDCREFLSAWNLFGDLKSGLENRNTDIEDKDHLEVYGKLFAGNNLPSMTPPGEVFTPTWTEDELIEIRSCLEPGLAALRRYLCRVENHEGV